MSEAPAEIIELVDKFERNLEAYKNPNYKEEQLKQEFINPFFKALGWDVDNTQGAAPQFRDVIFEDSIKIGGGTRAPDYCFTLAGRKMFFVEAKKPSVNIKTDVKPSFQLRRYAWTAKLPLSILTDFEEFAVYDSRFEPKQTDRASTGRIKILTYNDYVKEWDYLYNIFSKDAVFKGSFHKYAESTKKKRGTSEVDDVFLSDIENWRDLFAKNIALRNPDLTVEELNYSVQQTIDRIIFLRMCEDRGIEKYGRLRTLLDNENIYHGFSEFCLEADAKYNSGLFHFTEEKGRPTTPDQVSLTLNIDDGVFRTIIKSLYYPESPYEFSVLQPEILGNVYEQFLGKVIRLTAGHQAKVEEKPEVKKAGGVYYTPQYIVDYIVQNTVGKLCKGKTPNKVSELRILDPACGSGSFLMGAYNYLLLWHQKYYMKQKDKKKLKDKVYQGKNGEWFLTIREKKRILLNNIYGVDIDSQAVWVTKLSLLLKVLEGENQDALEAQQKLFKERALPDLGDNIKCGNSIVGPDIYDDTELILDSADIQRINPFNWEFEFSKILESGGFDAVIGNPPYVRQEMLKELKNYFKDVYKVYHGSADLYTYFVEKGISLLKINGIFSYIVANKWMKANYGQPLRIWLKKYQINEIIDFGDLQIFNKATTYPCILNITNALPKKEFDAILVKSINFQSLEDYVTENSFRVSLSSLNEDRWSLVDKKTQALLDKLTKKTIKLDEYVVGKIYRGIITGLGDAFIIDSETKARLIAEDPKSADLIKPFAMGKDIKPYQTPISGRFLIFMPKGWTKNVSNNNLKALNWLKENYPAIFNHLSPFAEAAKKRYDKGDFWWELRACDYYNEFEEPKIMYLVFQVKPTFTFDDRGVYANNAVWIIPKNDKYLLALLNSNLGWFLISNYCTQIRNGYQLIYKYLKNIPILKIDENNSKDINIHKRIVKLVEQMLQVNKDLIDVKTHDRKVNMQRQIHAMDKQIDKLVYGLYGLKEDEIKIIENSLNLEGD